MQSKGNKAKDTLIDYKPDREKGCPVKRGVNTGWFYFIVLHFQKYKKKHIILLLSLSLFESHLSR